MAEEITGGKTLKDVNDTLKKVNKNLEDPVQSVADKEAANEKARSDKDLKSIFQGIFDTLKGGFGAATLKDKKQGGLIAGLLGGRTEGLYKGFLFCIISGPFLSFILFVVLIV